MRKSLQAKFYRSREFSFRRAAGRPGSAAERPEDVAPSTATGYWGVTLVYHRVGV